LNPDTPQKYKMDDISKRVATTFQLAKKIYKNYVDKKSIIVIVRSNEHKKICDFKKWCLQGTQIKIKINMLTFGERANVSKSTS
jgi:hypothetical protein